MPTEPDRELTEEELESLVRAVYSQALSGSESAISMLYSLKDGKCPCCQKAIPIGSPLARAVSRVFPGV